VEQHVYPWTAILVSLHYENPTKFVVLVQRGHHHHLIEMYIAEKLLSWH